MFHAYKKLCTFAPIHGLLKYARMFGFKPISGCWRLIFAEISCHFAILRHGIKLAIFLIACLKCNFEGTSFELIKYLVTLIPERSWGFYLTLLYYCYTLPTRAAYTTNTHREKERRRVSSANTVSSIQTYKSVMPHIYEYRDFPRHPTHTALWTTTHTHRVKRWVIASFSHTCGSAVSHIWINGLPRTTNTYRVHCNTL